jgi:putative component of membrane protein insertase Oxa1/YidC/SpoIIIJ protein YidD/protein-S-isoprenylcysteine O-methyltransferase Ste14
MQSGLYGVFSPGPWEFRLRTFSHYGLLIGATLIHVEVAGTELSGLFSWFGPTLSLIVAMGVLALGIALRTWALALLPPATSLSLTVRTEVRVREGPYDFCAHPIYAGGFLTFVAFGLFLHPIALTSLVAASLLRYHRLAAYEEASFAKADVPVEAPTQEDRVPGGLTLLFWSLTELRFLGYALGFYACYESGNIWDLWPAILAVTTFQGLLVALKARYLHIGLASLLILGFALTVALPPDAHATPIRADQDQVDRVLHFVEVGPDDEQLPTGLMRIVYRWWVDLYRHAVSPGGMKKCGMYPNCSRYFHDATRRHGGCMGCMMSADRLFRCNGGRDTAEFYPLILTPHGAFRYDTVDENDFWFGPVSDHAKPGANP